MSIQFLVRIDAKKFSESIFGKYVILIIYKYIDMFGNYITGMIYTEHVYQSLNLQEEDN